MRNSIWLMGQRRGCSVVVARGVSVVAGAGDVSGHSVVFGSNDVGEGSVVVGSEPWWTLATWPQTAQQTRSLRTQLQRARNKGVTATALTSMNATQVTALVERWLRTRTMAPMGFVVDVDADDVKGADVVVVAEAAGAVVGVAAANVFDDGAPVGERGALVEFVLVDKGAPNGTGEFLVDAAFRALAERGVADVTLGLAPLRDDPAFPLPRFLRVARDLTGGLFDWRGLTSWKEKLKPTSWRPVTLQTHGVSAVRGVVEVLLAFARQQPLRFGLRTLLRGPPLFFRAVAAALLPWTLGLALVDDRHFPPVPVAGAVHVAWVAFDVVLALLLFWLAFRIKQRKRRLTLHRALAVVVGVDAGLTIAQAALWNAPRVERAVDVAVIVAGVLAPLLVDVVLWTSLRHRR